MSFSSSSTDSSTDTSSSTTSETKPWAGQEEYLEDVFGTAYHTYNNWDSMEDADKYAGVSPEEMSVGEDYYNWGQSGLDESNAWQDEYGSKWDDLYTQNQAQTDQWQSMIDDLWNTGVEDYAATAQALTEDDPYLQEAIDQSWANVEDLLNQDLYGVGGLDQTANETGNLNSSRAGVAQGVAEAEAAKSGQEAELELFSDTYDQYLAMAEEDASRLQDLAAQYEPDETGSDLLSSYTADMLAQEAGETSYLDAESIWGQLQTEEDQAELDNEWAQYEAAWEDLYNYYGIIGGEDWGQQSTSSTDSTSDTSSSTTTFGLSL